jgi:hypothetical protein
VGAEKSSGGAAVAQGETREVLLVGRDYAFVFEMGSVKSTAEIGRHDIPRSAVWLIPFNTAHGAFLTKRT